MVIDTDVLGIHNARWGTVQPIFSCQMIKTKHPSKCVSYKNAAIHGLSLFRRVQENQESHCLNGPHIPKVGCITALPGMTYPFHLRMTLSCSEIQPHNGLTTDSQRTRGLLGVTVKKAAAIDWYPALTWPWLKNPFSVRRSKAWSSRFFFVRKNT